MTCVSAGWLHKVQWLFCIVFWSMGMTGGYSFLCEDVCDITTVLSYPGLSHARNLPWILNANHINIYGWLQTRVYTAVIGKNCTFFEQLFPSSQRDSPIQMLSISPDLSLMSYGLRSKSYGHLFAKTRRGEVLVFIEQKIALYQLGSLWEMRGLKKSFLSSRNTWIYGIPDSGRIDPSLPGRAIRRCRNNRCTCSIGTVSSRRRLDTFLFEEVLDCFCKTITFVQNLLFDPSQLRPTAQSDELTFLKKKKKLLKCPNLEGVWGQPFVPECFFQKENVEEQLPSSRIIMQSLKLNWFSSVEILSNKVLVKKEKKANTTKVWFKRQYR